MNGHAATMPSDIRQTTIPGADETAPAKRGRGRPKGSKTRNRTTPPGEARPPRRGPESTPARADVAAGAPGAAEQLDDGAGGLIWLHDGRSTVDGSPRWQHPLCPWETTTPEKMAQYDRADAAWGPPVVVRVKRRERGTVLDLDEVPCEQLSLETLRAAWGGGAFWLWFYAISYGPDGAPLRKPSRVVGLNVPGAARYAAGAPAGMPAHARAIEPEPEDEPEDEPDDEEPPADEPAPPARAAEPLEVTMERLRLKAEEQREQREAQRRAEERDAERRREEREERRERDREEREARREERDRREAREHEMRLAQLRQPPPPTASPLTSLMETLIAKKLPELLTGESDKGMGREVVQGIFQTIGAVAQPIVEAVMAKQAGHPLPNPAEDDDQDDDQDEEPEDEAPPPPGASGAAPPAAPPGGLA